MVLQTRESWVRNHLENVHNDHALNDVRNDHTDDHNNRNNFKRLRDALLNEGGAR